MEIVIHYGWLMSMLILLAGCDQQAGTVLGYNSCDRTLSGYNAASLFVTCGGSNGKTTDIMASGSIGTPRVYTGTPLTDAMWKGANHKELTQEEQALIDADDRQAAESLARRLETSTNEAKAIQTADRAAHDLAIATSKRANGKKLSTKEINMLAAADDAAVAKVRQSAIDERERIERQAQAYARGRAQDADLAQCRYEVHASGIVRGYHPNPVDFVFAKIEAAAEEDKVLRLCLSARAAARY